MTYISRSMVAAATAAVTFRKDGDDYVVLRDGVELGRVVRGTRSTDSRIAGTRLRREGRGATEWRAEVPREQWTRPRTRDGKLTPMRVGQLQRSGGGWWRLEWRGEAWDRRGEAAAALVDWADYPVKRRAE